MKTASHVIGGLDLAVKTNCKCSFCAINKVTTQRIRRFVFGRISEYSPSNYKGFGNQ